MESVVARVVVVRAKSIVLLGAALLGGLHPAKPLACRVLTLESACNADAVRRPGAALSA